MHNSQKPIKNGVNSTTNSKHLLKIFIPHADIIPNFDHSETIEQFINSPMSLPAKHNSPSEILFLIKILKDGKSPDHDLITNKVLKNLPRKPILLITYLQRYAKTIIFSANMEVVNCNTYT